MADRLAALLDQHPMSSAELTRGGDLAVHFPHHAFRVVWRGDSRVASVASAVRELTATDDGRHALVAVPFMGPLGARHCAAAGVDWLDLSGNAHITGPGLRVVVQGCPNRFRKAGRPRSPFAPKSARLTRWLLQHPRTPVNQAELANATGVDPGFTSRIVRKLVDDELLARDARGRLVVPDPDLLLTAWAEDYAFDRHRVCRGVVAARSGEELANRLSAGARATGVEHAFTGLAAAWQYTRFATYRLVTLYVVGPLTDALVQQLGFREQARGANVWLVVPNDEGVLYGAAAVDGLRCVHPVQAWLDLLAHPERAVEAAERLRRERLDWGRDEQAQDEAGV